MKVVVTVADVCPVASPGPKSVTSLVPLARPEQTPLDDSTNFTLSPPLVVSKSTPAMANTPAIPVIRGAFVRLVEVGPRILIVKESSS